MSMDGDRQWTYAEVAAHLRVSAATARKYASDGRLPAPDGRLGVTPWWWPATIRAWQKARPGRGVGGGRPRKVREQTPSR